MMNCRNNRHTVRELLLHEVSGWKKLEVSWLIFSILTVVVISLITKDTALGMVSAITGVIAIVLTGKGKPSSYLFGSVYAITYAIITFHAAYYSSFFFELLIILPLEFVGLYSWIKHINKETHEVHKRQMKKKTWVMTILVILTASFLLGMLMKITNDPMPFTDSFTTIMMAAAMILAVMRYSEQWIVWIVVNILSTILWIRNFFTTGENGAILMMWCIYIANSIIMCIKWYRETKKHQTPIKSNPENNT